MRSPVPAIRWPGIRAGAVLVFTLSWDEILVTLFIAKFRILTPPRRIWDGIRTNADPTMAAAAVVRIAVTIRALGLPALRDDRGTTASDT